MEIQGIIKVVGETKSFGRNDFLKRELVITTTEEYPQTIMIEFVKDKCSILDNYAEGQEVKVGVNLRGREWVSPQGETKYFNSLQGWKIEALSGQPSQPANSKPKEELPNEPELPANEEDEDDDLPF